LGGIRGIGVWRMMAEDERGLRVEGKISGMNTDAGRLLYERVRDGAIGGLSIGFKVRGNGAVYGRNAGEPKRTIKSAVLGEISLVDDPCNSHARVDSIKSRIANGEPPSLREVEEMLREHPFNLSRTQATAFAGGGYKSLFTRESGKGEAASTEAMAALADLRASLAAFTLPSIR
jgi:phage head maturation protease